MQIFYGIHSNFIDVTSICIEKLLINNNISIPSQDVNRCQYFGDHISGVLKHIKVIDDNNNVFYFYENEEINLSLNICLDNNDSIEIINIDQYYNNIYDYDRNIPQEYLEKFEHYNSKNINSLNFEYMKKNINKEMLSNTIFEQLIPQDTFRYKYLKLMTIDVLLNKSLSFKCLKTGIIFRTTKSIYYLSPLIDCVSANYDDVNIYIFDNSEDPFIVAIGNGSNHMVLHTSILFVYYYKSKQLYSLNSLNHWLKSFSTIVKELNKTLLGNNYIDKNIIAFMFGYSVNIGHTYWNDLSGFKFLVDMDLLKYVDKFVIGPYDYYNIKNYLIKQKYTNIYIENNIENINELCKNDFLFKYNEMFMYENLKTFTIENLTEANEIIESEIEDVKNKHYPIVTFNLRGIYRNLHNQEEIISSIINYLLLVFPNMFVLFDGYVVNNETNLDFFKSEGIKSNSKMFDESYNIIVNSIINKINTRNFKSLIGTTIYEELKWLEISHYGLMQLGAGSFNYTWTMNKKCLYVGRNNYVNESLLIHTYHDFIFRENRDFTTYINPNMVDFNSHPNSEFAIDFETILYFMYRDLMILEKHNYNLTQFENLQKYNIYQSWGLELSLEELKKNSNILENLAVIKEYIISN